MPIHSQRWWEADAREVHSVVQSTVDSLLEDNRYRFEELASWFRLYGNYNAAGLSASQYFRPMSAVKNRLSLNVVQSAVDTAHSKITKNRPKPTFLTRGGSYSEQKKAKTLDAFTQGLFYQTDAYRTFALCDHDRDVFGTGIAKVFEDPLTNRVSIERVYSDEILIDFMESMYGKPRQMHQRKTMGQDELIAMFPEKEEVIRAARPSDEVYSGYARARSKLVTVTESWHLPSGKIEEIDADDLPDDPAERDAALMEGNDGRRVWSVSSGALFVGPWRKTHFGMAFLHWTEPKKGFWGQGIPEQLVGIQWEINNILRQIQSCLPFAVPRAFVRAGSKITLAHLNDVVGAIVKYDGVEPSVKTPGVIAPELFAQLDRLVRAAYEVIGISQLTATSRKPAGLESGASIREYHDIESERFADKYVGYENFVIDVSKLAIECAKEVADREGGYPVTVSKKSYTETIDWKEIDLSPDDYVLQIFPSSALPTTPAGRLAMVQDLMNLGFLDQTSARRLLNFPDLEAVNELAEASSELTHKHIEDMVEHGEPRFPQPYQDLDYAIRTAQSEILLASRLGVPEGNIRLLRNYIQAAVAMQRQATLGINQPQGAAVPGTPGIAAPLGIPGAPPPGAAAPPGPAPQAPPGLLPAEAAI